MTFLRRVFDITDPVIAWRLVLASWIAVILLMFPALTLTWRNGGLACLTMMPLEMALSMPYVGIIMALLTFGIFFTGLAPLLAIILANMVLSGGVTPPRLAACLAIYVTEWLVSGLTGYALGHA